VRFSVALRAGADFFHMDTIQPEWFFLASPLAALAVMAIVQAAAMRLWRGERLYHSLGAGFAAGLAALLLAQVVLVLTFPRVADRWVLAAIGNPAIFLLLAYCFFNFINVMFVSIRVRIFEECDTRGGFIGEGELRAVYDDRLIMEARVERMERQGHIARRGSRWILADRRYVPVAKVVFGLKQIVLRRASEFEKP
jgi:hypothetical protein